MLAKVFSCAVIGLEGAVVQVEVDIARGLPSFTIVGLPDTAVQQSRERVRAAIKNSGLAFPTTRLTVNLAPADLRKEGPAYDLPIALGILLANDQLWADLSSSLFVGELSLDGTVRHTDGILPMVSVAKDEGFQRVFVPSVDAPEASLIKGLEVIPVDSLGKLAMHLQGLGEMTPYQPDLDIEEEPAPEYGTDLAHVKGQEHVKRALEVAPAGGHNVLMSFRTPQVSSPGKGPPPRLRPRGPRLRLPGQQVWLNSRQGKARRQECRSRRDV